jgi:general secretion pathway protein A
MFTAHFKMSGHPFAERIPLDHILQDARLAEGLARLDYLADQGTIALVTGPVGSGKSTLLKLFIRRLSKNHFSPLYIHLTHIKAPGLLRLIVAGLGEKPRGLGKENLFLQIQEKTRQTDTTYLLVIDEAQLLDPAALIDLRLLVSSALDEVSPLKIVLCGQDGIRDLLKRSRHADLVQRISTRFFLPPLTRSQTTAYIDAQLKQAGAPARLFADEAKALLHEFAAGLPRQINNLATACLINAASRNLQRVDGDLVNQTVAELHSS